MASQKLPPLKQMDASWKQMSLTASVRTSTGPYLQVGQSGNPGPPQLLLPPHCENFMGSQQLNLITMDSFHWIAE